MSLLNECAIFASAASKRYGFKTSLNSSIKADASSFNFSRDDGDGNENATSKI